MQPTQPVRNQPQGFKPKWRHFHPLDRVWVQNPFEHDILFQVADEYNRPYQYRMRALIPSELPGGAIATLGVKHIVDELIQNSEIKGEQEGMWDANIRGKYEAKIIIRLVLGREKANSTTPGEIDLAVTGADIPEANQKATEQVEEAFPGLNQPDPQPGEGAHFTPAGLDPLPDEAKAGLNDMVNASLPKANTVVSPNNAHANAEG